MKKEIKEFKKRYGKFFDEVELIDVISWLEYIFEQQENEYFN